MALIAYKQLWRRLSQWRNPLPANVPPTGRADGERPRRRSPSRLPANDAIACVKRTFPGRGTKLPVSRFGAPNAAGAP